MTFRKTPPEAADRDHLQAAIAESGACQQDGERRTRGVFQFLKARGAKKPVMMTGFLLPAARFAWWHLWLFTIRRG